MMKAFTFSRLTILLSAISLLIAFTAFAQTTKTEIPPPNNTHGISNNLWNTYQNKTNLLLENVDEQSFLNYVIFANDGNMADGKYFVKYAREKIKKDKEELVYRVGKGTISKTEEVKAYFSSLQPKYSSYFIEFKKHREVIIETQNTFKAPINGDPIAFNCGSPCTNPGFESGTGFWDYSSGVSCGTSSSDPCSIVAGFSSTAHDLTTIGTYDAAVGGTTLPVVPPGGGNNAMELGDYTGTGSNASRASISFTVSAANANFTYRYAVVLQDPQSGHTDPERPYFRVKVRDAGGNVLPCGDYNVMAKPPMAGFLESFPGSAIWYRPWTTIFIPLSTLIGQCITVEFTVSDCSQGGHYGYAYIDGDCDPLQLLSSSPAVCGGNSVILSAPLGAAAYAWTNTAGGTTGIVGSTTGQTAVVSQAGTYEVAMTMVTGPSCIAKLNITIGSNPNNPVAAFTNTTVCAGAATQFTDASSPVGSINTWSWDFNGDGVEDSNLPSPQYTWATAGSYPVTLNISWGICNSTITQNVTVNPIVVPTITPAGPYCINASSVILTASAGGGTWSGTGITGGTNLTGAFDPANAVIGNNVITYAISGACPTSANTTIVVNPLPTAVVPTITPVCDGSLVTVPAFTGPVTGTTYAWTNSNTAIGLVASGTGNIASFTGTNNTAGTISGTITVTPTANGCPGTPSTFTITVYPTPTVLVPAVTPVCNTSTVTVPAFTSPISGSTYAWTNSNPAIGLAASGTGNISSFTGTNITTGTISGLITVTPTADGCPGIPSTFTITVYPTPTVGIPTITPVCNGSTVTVPAFTSPTAGATYTWTNSNTTIGLAASGSGDISSFTGTNSTSGTITGLITVIPTANSCTGISDTFSIAVYPTPTVIVPTVTPVCNASTLTVPIFTSPTTGATYAWTNSNTTIGLAASGTGNITSFTGTNSTTATITGTITVTPSANSCSGVPNTFTISVYPTPTVVVPTVSPVCDGSTVTVPVFTSPVTGATYTWTNSNTAIGLAASGLGNIASFTGTNTTSATITGTISVTPTADGCPGIPSSFTITVYPTPTVILPTITPVCNTSVVTVPAFTSPTTGATYTWTNNNPAIGLVASGTGDISSFTGTNLTATTISGLITVIPTANGCIGVSDTFSIAVYPTPTVGVPTITPVCDGSTVTIPAFTSPTTGATYAWTNSNTAIGLAASGSGNIISFTGTNTTAATISGTITVTPTANACPGVPSTFTISVYPTPTVGVPTIMPVCNGSVITVPAFTSPTAGSTYSWTNSNTAIGLAAGSTGAISSFSGTNSTAATISGLITVIPTANGCIGISDTFSIAVYPTPTVIVPTVTPACNASTVNIPAFTSLTTGATYAWTNSNTTIGLAASGTGNIASFTGINSTTATITGTITVTPTANSCPGIPNTFTISVYPTPTVVVPTITPVCDGSIVTVPVFTSTTTSTTYAWTNSNTAIGLAGSGMGDIASFTGTNSTTATITGTISVTPTANACQGIPSTFTITVYPTPTVEVATITPVCNGSAVSVPAFTSPTTGATYAWTNNNTAIGIAASGAGAIFSFNGTNLTASTISGLITVTPSANGCIGIPDTFSIAVYPTPTVVVPTITPVCNGTTITVPAFSSPTTGVTYAWTNNNTTIGLATNGTGTINTFTGTNSTNAIITALITVTPTANGCPGIPSTFIITIYPTPVSTPGPDQTICTGNTSLPFGTTNNPAYTYSWLPATGLSNAAIYNPTASLLNSGPPDNPLLLTTSYTVTTTEIHAGATCTSIDSILITVRAAPSVNAGSSQTVCAGKTITLDGFISGSATSAYWTGGTGTFSPNNTALNAIYTPGVADTAAGSVTLTLHTDAPSPCSSSNSPQTYYFWKNPLINFSVGPDSCPVHCVQFYDNSSILGPDAIEAWNWNFGDGLNANSTEQNPEHCYLTSGFYTVTLTASSVHCSTTDSLVQLVHVYDVPQADFTTKPNPASMLNSDVLLNDQSVSVSNIIKWEWDFGDGETLVSTTSSNPVHNYPNDYQGSYLAILTVENSLGCRDSILKEIIISPEFTFYIPNAFTPNGDGVNDYFFGTGIGIAEYAIYIFDRWGNMVFNGDHISKLWDGKANHGSEMAQQDVYVWKVKLTDAFGKKHNYIGTVTLAK